jgi:hypothetical protein
MGEAFKRRIKKNLYTEAHKQRKTSTKHEQAKNECEKRIFDLKDAGNIKRAHLSS